MSGLTLSIFNGVRTLYPGYFAMVMATGVIAIQANKLGFAIPAKTLVWVCVLTYAVLWLLTGLRAVAFRDTLFADYRSLGKGPAFFTTSAGTTVMGKSLLLVFGSVSLAIGLWMFAWVIWLFLIYSFGINLITSREKLPIDRTVSGVWLIIPVATQSLSILTSLLSPYIANHALVMLTSLCLFMLGCALYLIVTAVVMARLALFKVEADDLKPAYWVCMGASAISTLAGVELCRRVDIWKLPFQPLASLQGFTMFFWVIAAVWIPLLVGLGVWRHVVCRTPLKYDPQYWSMVFPLAMFSISTGGVADIFKMDSLKLVSDVFLFIAFVAWVVVLVGLLKNLLAAAASASRSHSTEALSPHVDSRPGLLN